MGYLTMTIKPMLAAMAVLATTATATHAQTARFAIEKTDDGFVRMDTETGQMSVCTLTSDQLVCKMAADERSAFDADIVALEDRVAALEQRLGAGATGTQEGGLPDEQEFEQTLDYMERFMNRFMGIVEGFSGNETQEPAPDRT